MASSRLALLLLVFMLTLSSSSSREWFRNISTSLFELSGDIMIGGLFPLNDVSGDLSQQLKPDDIQCTSLNTYGLGLAIVMKYAIDEVNANPQLLPGIRLGFRTYDTCKQSSIIVRPTISFLTEKSSRVLSVQCNYTDYETSMSAVIGPNGSEMVSVIGKLLGFFLMPQISYRATSDKFSDKSVYPSFFRTVPSDKWQVEVMVELMKRFEWNWVAVIGSEEEYGQMGVQEFSKLAEQTSVCVAYQGLIPVYTDPGPTIQVLLSNIRATNVNVVVVFSLPEAAAAFFREVIKQKITAVWVGSTSWANNNVVSDISDIQTIGTVIGFIDKTQPVDLLTEYTTTLFGKIQEQNLNSSGSDAGRYPHNPCPQCHRLSPLNISIVEHAAVQLSAFSVYAAVYSVVQALHQLLHCDHRQCDWDPASTKIYPWKLLQVMKNISYDINGTKLEYDSSGNPNIGYDVVQWVWNDTTLHFRNVGSFLQNLTIDKSLFTWHTEDSTVPVSTCSAACEPGQVRRVKGFHSCCFDCIDCQPGTYQANPDDIQCSSCPKRQWSSKRSTSCTDPTFEVLWWGRSESVLMLLAGALLLLSQSSVLLLLVQNRSSPLVLASGGPLAFVALLGLMGACLTLLLFFGQPTDTVCRLQLPLTSICQSVSLSIISSIALQIFFVSEFPARAAPHLNTLWGPGSWLLVLSCCVAQAGICGWFVQEAPSLSLYLENMEINFVSSFLTCPVEPLTGLALLQGFNVALALLSFMCTFMAVKPLHQYNVSRDITFSCLIYCVIWVSFIPIYIGLSHKNRSIVHVSFSLGSNFGLIAGYYFPKCYLLLRKPELNTPQYFCTVLEGVAPTAGQDQDQSQSQDHSQSQDQSQYQSQTESVH